MDVSSKLFHHPKNLESLSVIAAALFNNKSQYLIESNVEGGLISSLVLETKNKTLINSVNSIVCYLFNEDPLYSKLYSWLLWEATDLKPVLQHYITSSYAAGRSDAKFLSKAKKLLNTLDTYLKDKVFIQSSDKPTSIDIILWADLLPVLVKDSPALINGFVNVDLWFSRLDSLEACKTASKTVLGKAPVNVIKGLASRIKAIHLPDSSSDLNDVTGAEGSNLHQPKKGKETTQPATDDEPVAVEVEVTEAEMKQAADFFLSGQSQMKPLPTRSHPILPQADRPNLLITSALPYVNNVPHLGNIVGAVLSADAFSRFCRLRGYNVLYVSGTDEYGTATETKALADGVTPRQICDKYHVLHAQIYRWFNIDFDYFGRTTTDVHSEISREIFGQINARNYILRETVEQLFCPNCSKFLADRFVGGECPFCHYDDARGDQCDKCGKLINAVELIHPKCKTCKHTPIIKSSDHLFLDLPNLQPKLESYLSTVMSDKDSLWTSNARTITQSWIRDGLKPRCITRDLKWGVNVPLEGYTDKVFYVWYDAPIGYLSITANYTKEWRQWWKNDTVDVTLYNFMAKDNVPFHSVIFPACLLATGEKFTMVRHLISCEYLNYEDVKFSKSRGVGVFGDNAMHSEIPADIWRFYLLYTRPESQDSTFMWDDFLLKNNSELLNNLGNFINRALIFLSKFFGSTIPAMDLLDTDKAFLARINKELNRYITLLDGVKIREAITCIFSMSRLGNQYIQINKPWLLVKKDDTKSRAGTVTGVAVNVSCLLGVLLQPFMPATSATIQDQCQAPSYSQQLPSDAQIKAVLPPGHKIGIPVPLFKKLEAEYMSKLKMYYSGSQVVE